MRRIFAINGLVITENLNASLVGLGTFFYTEHLLYFGDTGNLWLGFGIGVSFIIGALLSHPISVRLGERKQLKWIIAITLLTHAAMGAVPHVAIIVGGSILLNLLNGLKWPVMESYVTAGQTQSETSKALGWFNIYWSGMVVVGLLLAGPLIRFWPPSLFYSAMLINVLSLFFLSYLEARLVHLAEDHPDRPDEQKMQFIRELLSASRWGLVLGFLLTAILNPLMPGIFRRMDLTVEWATALASVVYAGRWGMFVVMQRWTSWHDRTWPIVMMLVLLPVSFFMVVYEHDMATVVLGGLIFGMLESVAYYTALYYAMVVKNAAVDAGGHHEALIGVGFTAGPLAALLGQWMVPILGSAAMGFTVGIGPLSLGMVGAGLWPICRKKFVAK